MTSYGGPLEWPHLERYSDTPVFNTKAVVQQTGVPAPTLRAWERRYDLIEPERAGNTYRLYSQRDIALIRWLKEQVDAGISISQAIALFRHLQETQEQPTTAPQGTTAFEIAVPPPTPEDDPGMLEEPEPPGTGHETWEWSLPADHYMHSGYPSSHTMRAARENLIEAFQRFDEQAVHVLMGSLLSLYPVEQVCMEVITPMLWQIGQLWAEGELTVSVEHFASHFMRAFLMTRFHITPGPHTGPVVLCCSSPGEPHELAPLMLALFLRLQGVRVIYLGQSIETTGLLHTVQQLRPAMLCVSLTMAPYLPNLVNLGHCVQRLPEPRPLFVFGGQALSQYATIIPQIPGYYMDGDLRETALKLRALLVEQPS